MTTIAYRFGVLAADTRAYGGDRRPLGQKTKIRALESGELIGCSSPVPGTGEAVMDWYASGMTPKHRPDVEQNFTFIAVSPDGTARVMVDSFNLTGPIVAEFFAIGSGEDYALAAMSMGADAMKAVEVAAIHDVFTSAPFMSLTHKQKKLPSPDGDKQLDLPLDKGKVVKLKPK